MRLNKIGQRKISFLFENSLKKLFRKHFSLKHMLLEGGAGKHMMHPYEMMSMSIADIKEIMNTAKKGIKVPEKFDGSANLHFSIKATGQPVKMEDIVFIRHDDPDNVGNFNNNLQWLRQKFAASPGIETMFIGAKAIAMACLTLDPKVVSDTFNNPDPKLIMQGREFRGTYVNCDIIFPKNPIQINYGQFRVAMHGLKDYYLGADEKGKPNIDWTDDSEIDISNQKLDTSYSFDTYNDPRFVNFTNALKEALITITNEELIQGLNPEYFKPEEFAFSYGGKELLSLNQLSEEDVAFLLKDILEMQTKYSFDDNTTLGDIKSFFIYKVVPDEIQRVKTELLNFPQIAARPDVADYLANYLVNNAIVKEDVAVQSGMEQYTVGAVAAKKVMKDTFKLDKDVISAMTDAGLFTADAKKNKYYKTIISNLKPEINEQIRLFKDLFYNLGVKLLSGVKSTMMSEEYAQKESARMTEDVTNALADYYSLPYFDELNYVNSRGKKVPYMDYEQFKAANPDSPIDEVIYKRYSAQNNTVDRGRYDIYKIELLIQNANRKLGIPVDINNKADVLAKAKNLQVDAVEGVVFNFKGNKFKFTGAYAPINQLLGFNYAKTLPAYFPRYYAKKINWEQDASTTSVCIIPGSFKPPHMGHRRMIEHYIGLGCQQILVIVSDPKSDTSIRTIGNDKVVSGADSVILWNKLCADLQGAKVDFIVSPSASPLDAAISLAMKGSKIKDNTTVYFGGSLKTEDGGGDEEAGTDADRMNGYLSHPVLSQMLNPTLNIPNPGQNGAPAARLPGKYLTICQQAGIYEMLPSVQKGKDPGQFHASDLRFYLNEVINQPQLKQAMVYYLKDLITTNFYINYIWGADAQNKSSVADSQITLEESLLRKYIKLLF